MLKTARKILGLGIKAARITKREAEKEINAMVKEGIINKGEGKELLRRIVVEADQERKRFQNFLKAEFRRELRKAKPLMKEVAKRSRKVAARSKPRIKKIAKKALRTATKGARSAARKAAKRAGKKAARVRVRVRSIRKKR